MTLLNFPSSHHLSSSVQDDVSGELLPVYELHQVNMQDGTASIERIGELIVLYDNSEDPIKLTVALSESEILFQADSWSLIWDVSRKQVSAWAIEGVTNVSHVSQSPASVLTIRPFIQIDRPSHTRIMSSIST